VPGLEGEALLSRPRALEGEALLSRPRVLLGASLCRDASLRDVAWYAPGVVGTGSAASWAGLLAHEELIAALSRVAGPPQSVLALQVESLLAQLAASAARQRVELGRPPRWSEMRKIGGAWDPLLDRFESLVALPSTPQQVLCALASCWATLAQAPNDAAAAAVLNRQLGGSASGDTWRQALQRP
jgi:hypothetical protein